MSNERLSSALFRETRGAAFFRILAGKNAPFYVDALTSLEREASDNPDGISREVAIGLIEETLEAHPEIEFDPEELAESRDLREKARNLLDVFLKSHWLEEPPRRDWRRMLLFDAHGSTMISALRKIAWPEAAVFTDKITAVCAMLADDAALSEQPWQIIESCLASIHEGINELRSMQKSVQRHTRKQLEEETLQGNLAVVFDEYADQISHSCYAALVRARLPTRLPDAVNRIASHILNDAAMLNAMQEEVLIRFPEITAESARTRVHFALDELIELLDQVLPMADEIDRRTADFTRRSLARFRYLQDVTGERRTEVKSFFESVNHAIAGRKLQRTNASLPELPELLLPAVKLPGGLDTLYSPPNRRPPMEQDPFEDAVSDEDRAVGLDGMQRTIRESLSVARANRLIESFPGGKGERIESDALTLPKGATSGDLIALFLHAEAPDASYRLDVSRVAEEHLSPPLDTISETQVERFAVIKK
ncbi:hypothetical protein NT6N_27940 [Oceaniferula spumae]|uniref:DUF1631 family protein n=1 Tax=Oceaniferula spumae TaxID=2979115 RepID=A0AAT9FP93_9BACT